jgi:hypothetical protein
MIPPIICFGQQPSGFFPKRFLVAKINTARKLQQEIGGRIIFFYHDSDADYRETITIMRDRQTNAEARLNFIQENKLQKKFSPLYLKRVPTDWKEEILKQLPRFTDKPLMDIFSSIDGKTVADFCLDMYQKMGLLDGIEVVRSSDKNFREKAGELIKEYFADILYENEIVRAQLLDGKFQLHEGGGKYLEISTPKKIEKWQKNPARDERFAWMQSVINCTHYIYGEGEKDYLNRKDFPTVQFVDREKIDGPNFAYLG